MDSFCSFSPHMVPLLPSQPWRAVLHICTTLLQDFSGGSVVKKKKYRLPMQETPETLVQSLGRDDSLEEEVVTHSSICAWKIPWTEEPGGRQSLGSQKSWTQLSNLITMCIFHHETILMHLLIKLRQSRRETLYVSVIFLVYEICLEKNILLVCFLPFSKYSQKSDFFSCCKPILPPLFY